MNNMDKRNDLLNKLKDLIGKNVTVHIDRPIEFHHFGIIYECNYGYIKEYVALDNEYQDAYVLGIDKPINEFNGKVICIVNRTDDVEDKLIVCDIDKNYTNEEIEELIYFQEKYFKHILIR